MASGTPVLTVSDDEVSASSPIKTRDAGNTQQLLLHAARRRFARDGYAATTVREIAADAGVNVALINRYFTSKEGLFEACLTRVVERLERPGEVVDSIERAARDIIRTISDSPNGDDSLQLLLLLRTSGDEGAERIRRATFRNFTERLAAAAGWRRDDPTTEHLMLRAQLAMATAFGTVLLRSTSGLEPLTSASESELSGPLTEVLTGLLAP
ncbi:TetR/AcrR family transcriptional regulator [Leifsonia poae]|uniref:HTH tetR-type domain-containing protein n=1 Tax=Leifsonia poae TaxID=110933 RepID=A0A9W6LZH3_9MICO|nr:TetR/AcrR family transcriptional regulator [Leifsonia poae]GLJ76243.1 hypothetical protein GCM10017584_18170 [Leifsonia poae]